MIIDEAHSDMEQPAGLLGVPDDGPSLRALGRVLGDLADLGYDAEWRGLRAADVGAPHGRFRVFVLAHAQDQRHERSGLPRLGWSRPENRGGEPVALLPTPSASVANDGEGVETWESRRQRVAQTVKNGNGFGTPLTIAVQLLPTPKATNNENRQSEDRYRPNLGMILGTTPGYVSTWGKYADAIARWEHLTRPAPAPTEPGPKGNPRLSARFAEWLMGLDDGWVTDVPGITRNEALKALGNGVVPQQAAAALAHMLASFYTTQLTEGTSA